MSVVITEDLYDIVIGESIEEFKKIFDDEDLDKELLKELELIWKETVNRLSNVPMYLQRGSAQQYIQSNEKYSKMLHEHKINKVQRNQPLPPLPFQRPPPPPQFVQPFLSMYPQHENGRGAPIPATEQSFNPMYGAPPQHMMEEEEEGWEAEEKAPKKRKVNNHAPVVPRIPGSFPQQVPQFQPPTQQNRYQKPETKEVEDFDLDLGNLDNDNFFLDGHTGKVEVNESEELDSDDDIEEYVNGENEVFTHLMVARSEKCKRKRGKKWEWKLKLFNGVVNMGGKKEYIFRNCDAHFDWS